MDATLVVIDSDAELARAQNLIARLMASSKPSDTTRLKAQAQLVAAYEQRHWPARCPSPAAIIQYLMDQHGLTRADMVPLLGTRSRVSEILSGKKRLSLSMVLRLRARFHVPADLLIAESHRSASSRNAGPRSAKKPASRKGRRAA
jgi:HTH-type transcriptional regulator/antitoxin HigA